MGIAVVDAAVACWLAPVLTRLLLSEEGLEEGRQSGEGAALRVPRLGAFEVLHRPMQELAHDAPREPVHLRCVRGGGGEEKATTRRAQKAEGKGRGERVRRGWDVRPWLYNPLSPPTL